VEEVASLFSGCLIGTSGTRTSFVTDIPDLFTVVTVLCVNALANKAESGPMAFVRRRLIGGPLMVDEKECVEHSKHEAASCSKCNHVRVKVPLTGVGDHGTAKIIRTDRQSGPTQNRGRRNSGPTGMLGPSTLNMRLRVVIIV